SCRLGATGREAKALPARGRTGPPAATPARRYGFRGGLVPGVIVYAYLTEPLVAGLGEAWLARGTAHARFRRPVIHAEDVTVTGDRTGRDARAAHARGAARTDAAGGCRRRA